MAENPPVSLVTLTITRYPVWAIPFALLSMAVFRLPLVFNKKLNFWRLMGSGKSGTFDKTPDLKQWGIMGSFNYEDHKELLLASENNKLVALAYGRFIAGWLNLFCIENHTYLLEPIEGHGLWNGREVFGSLPKNTDYEGSIAIMTRATLRISKLGRFWQHVPQAAAEMAAARGFIKSYGLGEWPWIKQATFSLWESKEAMRAFAYKSQFHKEVIRKTHLEKWYSEEMFVRFRVVARF